MDTDFRALLGQRLSEASKTAQGLRDRFANTGPLKGAGQKVANKVKKTIKTSPIKTAQEYVRDSFKPVQAKLKSLHQENLSPEKGFPKSVGHVRDAASKQFQALKDKRVEKQKHKADESKRANEAADELIEKFKGLANTGDQLSSGLSKLEALFGHELGEGTEYRENLKTVADLSSAVARQDQKQLFETLKPIILEKLSISEGDQKDSTEEGSKKDLHNFLNELKEKGANFVADKIQHNKHFRRAALRGISWKVKKDNLLPTDNPLKKEVADNQGSGGVLGFLSRGKEQFEVIAINSFVENIVLSDADYDKLKLVTSNPEALIKLYEGLFPDKDTEKKAE